MSNSPRPPLVSIFSVALLAAALATGYVGLTVKGFLVPALALVLAGAMLWFGFGWRAFFWLLVINLVSGIATDLVLAIGDGLGHRKLDISGVALLINLASGGPLMGFLAAPLLALSWWKPSLRAWFERHSAEACA